MPSSLAAIWRWRPAYPVLLLLALLLQGLCVLRAFGALLFQPGQHLLVTSQDGAKNYFTFQAYIQQPWSNGLSWFGMMNHPFGEYLFFTDNTPLLAVPVRLWSHYISDLAPHGLDVYHGLMLAGFFLSTALLVAILRRLVQHWGLVLVFAVVLPWLNPQTSRLLVGHFNLSYSWLVLLVIWGLLGLYQRVRAGSSIRGWVLALVAGSVVAGLIHLYYLPLLALTVAGFFAAWLLPRQQWRNRALSGAAVLITLLPTLLCFLIVRLTDGYRVQRSMQATGFNYAPWKLQLSALIKPGSYQTVHFWLEPKNQPTYESVAYLGAFALFGLTFFVVAWLVRKPATQAFWQAWKAAPERIFLQLLLLAALVGLGVSLGTEYAVADDQYIFQNYFSAFYYLQKVTQVVTHFRAVGRFSWPFFWAVNLLVLVALDFWLRRSQWRGRWVVAVALVVLALLDTRDTLKYYRKSLLPNLLTDERTFPELQPLLQGLRPEQYQAILPVPFFHVGSENLELTVDDDNAHSLHAYELALRTNLPLVASKLSRTPEEHVQQLRSLFSPTGPTPELRAQLQAARKPLLVLLDESYYDGSIPFAQQQANPLAKQLIEAGAALPSQQPLMLVAQSGKLRLYRWNVQ
ncbi:hypothetical protein ACFPAF_08970 [Hymenobacter endophyticus]|uniref:DUF6311 domain-containing protein n=1 Tax=Hymenobacter endophyticus TaxID=3076335 RepID=A0ABU3TGP9_9BACT|nr:hypothetical protein [Hymenobacter endophyticus]MDU0370520.1 hypothetical protein [Hymenobacter endophyticus]